MANLSDIDDMPNITANFTDEVYVRHVSIYERIFLEMFTFIGLGSVIANSLLIFVILKYKKMREDATNKIFLHINILQAIYLFAAPLTLRISTEIFNASPLHLVVFCVSYQIESSVIFVMVLFMFLLICDWFLKLYYEDKYVKFCKVHKFSIIALYIILLCIGSLMVQACFHHMMIVFVLLTMFICCIILVVFLIVMNIVHAFKKRKLLSIPRKSNIGLAIANICLLCWCPFFLFLIILVLGVYVPTPVLFIILSSLGFSSPMCNLLYLYLYDDKYHIFLRQVFKCRCSDYQNENLVDQPVIYSDANGVKIDEN